MKKTSKAMCEELGNEDLMTEYVEEYGNTSLCAVETEKGCDERDVTEMLRKCFSPDKLAKINRGFHNID